MNKPTTDGYYWYRNWINLDGGGHVRDWKLAKVIGDKVQCFGTANLIPLDCPYLKNAIWEPATPPVISS